MNKKLIAGIVIAAAVVCCGGGYVAMQNEKKVKQENVQISEMLGLGGVWFGIAPVEEHMEKVHRLLDLPENVKVFSMFALGYPAETRSQQDRFYPDRIHFIEK